MVNVMVVVPTRTVTRTTRMAGDRCDLLCLDLDKAEALRARVLSLEAAERAARDARAPLGRPARFRAALRSSS
jgi:hypothetical protein